MKFQVTLCQVKCAETSLESATLRISLEADLNVLALSNKSVEGKPCLFANLQKARRNEPALRLETSYKCTAHIEAHVNRQTYEDNSII